MFRQKSFWLGLTVATLTTTAAGAAGVSVHGAVSVTTGILPPVSGSVGVGVSTGPNAPPGGMPGSAPMPSSAPLFNDTPTDWASYTSSNRGNRNWGDPLGADLFGSDKIKARVHYYGDAGAQRSEQAVGLTLSIAN